MSEILVPDPFAVPPFYKQGETIPIGVPWYEKEHSHPFMEDIINLPPPVDAKSAAAIFFSLCKKEGQVTKCPLVCTARYIQIFHWLDGKSVKGVKEGIRLAGNHPAAPWNAVERLEFVLEAPEHFARKITMKQLIKEAGPKLKIAYKI